MCCNSGKKEHLKQFKRNILDSDKEKNMGKLNPQIAETNYRIKIFQTNNLKYVCIYKFVLYYIHTYSIKFKVWNPRNFT